MTAVVGLDLSLTATGVAGIDGTVTTIAPLAHDTPTGLAEHLAYLRLVFDELVGTHVEGEPPVWVVEDLPRNPRYGGVQLGMVHALWRETTWRRSVVGDVVYVPPASLKKYATGSGNAGKPQMVAEAIRRLGYEGHDHNEADALWLRAMGLDALGAPVCEMPKANRDALAKVAWPTVERAA